MGENVLEDNPINRRFVRHRAAMMYNDYMIVVGDSDDQEAQQPHTRVSSVTTHGRGGGEGVSGLVMTFPINSK